MQKNIWLIGGTTESKQIALAIARFSFVITVTTESARSLYPSNFRVWVGKMNYSQMLSFCQQRAIYAIVDASHPYATEVSHNAIATARRLQLPYLRYERLALSPKSPGITILDSFATLLAGDYLKSQRVLLAVGCKVLPLFQPWQTNSTLFARILPKTESLQIAIAAGFTSDRIIALRPPISPALEIALWQQWQISLVVTKASGTAGGEDSKRKVAAQLNIPLIIIARPQVSYPQQTNTIDRVISFCRELNCH